jgi:hypothetical protein
MGNGLVRIFCWDGRNPAKFMLGKRELQRLSPGSGVCLEGTTKIRTSYGVAEFQIVDGGHGAEVGARSDELQLPDGAGR